MLKTIATEIASLIHDTFEAILVCLTIGSLMAVVILLTDRALWQ